jgi:hypothetical protein
MLWYHATCYVPVTTAWVRTVLSLCYDIMLRATCRLRQREYVQYLVYVMISCYVPVTTPYSHVFKPSLYLFLGKAPRQPLKGGRVDPRAGLKAWLERKYVACAGGLTTTPRTNNGYFARLQYYLLDHSSADSVCLLVLCYCVVCHSVVVVVFKPLSLRRRLFCCSMQSIDHFPSRLGESDLVWS